MLYFPSIPSPIKGFLFDLDGTLVDTESLHFTSTNQVLEKHGYSIEREEFDTLVGWGEKRFWDKFKERYQISETTNILVRRRTQKFLDLLQNTSTEPFPGVSDLLELLQDYKIPYAVSSGSTRTQIASILKSANLSHLLPIWFSGYDDVKCGKPCPDVYLMAAKALGVEPRQCIVVEDTYTGMVAARAAGAFVIALSSPEKSEPSFDIADLKLTSFLDLFNLIKPILAERSL